MAIRRRFRAGSKIRVKSNLTRKMCDSEVVPYSFPGAHGVVVKYSSTGNVAIRVNRTGSMWYISEKCLETYCMFDGKEIA